MLTERKVGRSPTRSCADAQSKQRRGPSGRPQSASAELCRRSHSRERRPHIGPIRGCAASLPRPSSHIPVTPCGSWTDVDMVFKDPSFEGRTISAQNGGTAFHTLRRPVGAWVDAHFKRTAHNVPSETSIRACNSDPPKYANISCVPRRGDHAAIGMGWSEADPAARARGKGKLGRPSKAMNGPPRTVL